MVKNPRKNANIVYYLQINLITKNKIQKKKLSELKTVSFITTQKNENKLRAVLQYRQIIPR